MDRKIPALAALALLIATPTPALSQLNECVRPSLGFDLFNGNGNGRFRGNGFGNGNGFVNGNGFCRDYRRIILTRSEYESIRNTPRAVRNRIQANDLLYLCRCEGFRSPLCTMNGR
jgi:hypothetical protein